MSSLFKDEDVNYCDYDYEHILKRRVLVDNNKINYKSYLFRPEGTYGEWKGGKDFSVGVNKMSHEMSSEYDEFTGYQGRINLEGTGKYHPDIDIEEMWGIELETWDNEEF